jgi:hypothetical protein
MIKGEVGASLRCSVKIRAFVALSLFGSPLLAQQQSPPMPHDMNHMQHGGFMQGGMKHEVAKGVKLEVKTDTAAHTITLRIGPMNLPANTSHMKMAQPPDLTWTIENAGWLLAYHAKLVDVSGGAVPGVVLHHTAFWNENRSDFLCPNKDEHIFGAGGELTDWAAVPGFGYRVEKGDRLPASVFRGCDPLCGRRVARASEKLLPGMDGRRRLRKVRLRLASRAEQESGDGAGEI